MISVHAPCSACGGNGGAFGIDLGIPLSKFDGMVWVRCRHCDGTGRGWAPGAPAFGCEITLADRDPGEIVTLGNGQRAKIAWHMPRKAKKVRPETTFLLAVDEFTDAEHATPVPYPSCVGVVSVDVARAVVDREAHGGEKIEDLNDPVQRTVTGMLI